MTEVHVIGIDELEAETETESQIVDANGRPVRTQEAGKPCIKCGAAGSYVRPVMGGGCVCMAPTCGYQE